MRTLLNVEGLLARGRRIYLVDLLWRAIGRYERSECAIFSTAAAFSLLLSLFPLLIVFVAVFALLLALPGLGSWIDQITVNRVPGDGLRRLVESISGIPVVANGFVGFLGLATLTWAASGMFATLRQGLIRALGMVGQGDIIRARALDVARVLGLFLIVLLFIGVATLFGALQEVAGRFAFGRAARPIWTAGEWLISYALLVLVVLFLYALVPNHQLGARTLWSAALLAGAGIRVTALGFGYYLDNFAQFQQVYGALAGAVALLIFLKFNATIFFFAATLVSEAAQDRRRAMA